MSRRPAQADRSSPSLPLFGDAVPEGPVLLDTNVFINALTSRGPLVLRQMLQTLPRFFVSAPIRAELAWIDGRLDPTHPGTARVVAAAQGVQSRIDPAKVLVPGDADWHDAGERAGRIAREAAGGGRRIATAFDRVELIHDTLTAIVAARAGCVVVTEDRDFAALMRFDPRLQVLFYDRAGG
ncbi:MAG TPA: PIN domain-containing protein [Acetobacteraceae bacterium]|nr:PIN domain-containing protein [Acetobacteraceae bacterium]